MPRIAYNQTNFTAGELSPQVRGRVDFDKYPNGAKTMKNAFPVMYGGARKHAGSRLIASTKFQDKKSRLIPFVLNRKQAYIAELGDGYVRFYTPQGQVVSNNVPVELVSTFQESELFNIEYTQDGRDMFMSHEDVPPQRLTRLSDAVWAMGAMPFSITPHDEIGFRPQTTLTISGTTATAGAATFLPSDAGRDIVADAGVFEIASVTSPTTATGTITTPFVKTSFAVDEWKLDGSPRTAISPSLSSPENMRITVTAHGDPVVVTKYSWSNNVLTLTTAAAHGLVTGNKAVLVGFESSGLNGTYEVTGSTNSMTFTISYSQSVLSGGSLGVVYKHGTGQAWRPTDVGSFIKLNGGRVRITGFVSAAEVIGTIVTEMTSTIAAPEDGWALEAAMWNEVDGYPRSIAIHQQRLVAAGSPGFPRSVWGSMTGLYHDFTRSTEDDGSYLFKLSSTESNGHITHIASVRKLIVMTEGGEFSGGSITPTNPEFDPETAYGSNEVRPVRVGSKLLFVQGEGRRIRSYDYSLAQDSYDGDDLTLLSEHLTDGGIIDMAYCKEPYSVLFAVRADGVLITLTYNPNQNVVGWSSRETDGKYESVACIPDDGVDRVFAVVRREINGQVRRFVEILDFDIGVDCAAIGSSAAPNGDTVWTGLSHLEGKTVDVISNGAYAGAFVVQDGEIEIPYPSQHVVIGLQFRPVIDLLPPEIQTQTGSSAIGAMNTSEVTIRFNQTASCTVNDQEIVSRQFGDELLDQPVPMMNGDKRIENLDAWNRGDSPVRISQNDPLPFHILSVIRRVTIND